MFKYILNRLTERSTWIGLIAIATAGGASLEPTLSEYIISAGMAIAGLIGVVTQDKAAASSSTSTSTIDRDNG